MKRTERSYRKSNAKRKARLRKRRGSAQTAPATVPTLTIAQKQEEKYSREQQKKKADDQKFAVYLFIRDMVSEGWNEMLALRTIYKNYKAKKGRRFEPGFPMETFGTFLNAFKRFQRRENKTMVKR